MESEVKKVLDSINLGVLFGNFAEQHIDSLDTCQMLDDKHLERLGLNTIGDRVRFREALKKTASANKESGPAHAIDPVVVPPSLFRSSSRSLTRSAKSNKTVRTWTNTFVCLADKETNQVPISSVKDKLQKAGLGQKRIQFSNNDSSEDVREMLTSSSGFPKLLLGGGFELLTCQSNCKKLQLITSGWDVKSLKNAIGSQTKIYIRPIQHNLDIGSLNDNDHAGETSLEEKCKICSKNICMVELRDHIKKCSEECNDTAEINEHSETESDLLDPGLSHSQEPIDQRTETPLTDAQERTLPNLNVPVRRQRNDFQVIAQIDVPIDVDPPAESVHVIDLGLVAQAQHKNEDADLSSASDDQKDILLVAQKCVDFCEVNRITDPTEILRYIQSKIVTGRKLDVDSISNIQEGETNFICIDRTNIVTSSFEEIGSITDLRKTLEVQFYDESAVDLGGPRKEFFALILHAIYEQYFDPVKEYSQDYVVIGKILALSLLQNGKLPRVLNAELIDEVFKSDNPRRFVQDLRKGLDSLGLYQIISKLPILVHFFTSGNENKLTLKMLINLLKPNFSPRGANRRTRENQIYSKFVKYLREAAGRMSADLGSVLRFATGAEEEPCLGFIINPSIEFVESASFLPTANTCVNRLNLTIASDLADQPPDTMLQDLFDYAFCNQFFGLK